VQARVRFVGPRQAHHWREFLKKGYYVVPSGSRGGACAVANRWFYEGRKKDTPEPYPLPSDYVSNYLDGLQTVSGKYEFIAQTLKRSTTRIVRRSTSTCRPTRIRSRNPELAGFPLQLLSPHSRYRSTSWATTRGAASRHPRAPRVEGSATTTSWRGSAGRTPSRGDQGRRPDPHLEPPRLGRVRGAGHGPDAARHR
jgi:hypothetical protein